LDSGSDPCCENVSKTSASYLLNVMPCRRSNPSSSAMKICCARMIDVTARIAA